MGCETLTGKIVDEERMRMIFVLGVKKSKKNCIIHGERCSMYVCMYPSGNDPTYSGPIR